MTNSKALRLRGAVLVETALLVGAALTMTLGAVQLGVIGFYQLTADGATYVAAQKNGIRTGVSGESIASGAFSQVQTSDLSSMAVPAPTPNVPVHYGYNSGDPNAQYDRHGGASIMQPTLLQENYTNAAHDDLEIIGVPIPIPITSEMIEPQWEECGPLFDVADAGCSLSSPSSDQAANYFQNGENTPPYYIGFNLLAHCDDRMPYGGTCSSSNNSDILSLGVAEFLDLQNWPRGTDPSVTGISGDVASGSANQGTFFEIAGHQRYYATLAQWLQSNTFLPVIQASLGFRYSTGSGSSGIDEFASWGFPTSIAGAASANTSINTIYSWDRIIPAGIPPAGSLPGSDPLNPDIGL
ncbi:MAG: TadE/TadG family type IV pilus assembly protein [Vulcanimicrobiaceae bacterium]